jgi:hypothetical protein
MGHAIRQDDLFSIQISVTTRSAIPLNWRVIWNGSGFKPLSKDCRMRTFRKPWNNLLAGLKQHHTALLPVEYGRATDAKLLL